MLTNLIASVVVSVVTNTVDVMPMMSVPGDAPVAGSPYTLEMMPGSIYVDAVYRHHMVPVPNPTNKVQVTTRMEVTTMTFDWMGERREVRSVKTNWVMRLPLVLKRSWEMSGLGEVDWSPELTQFIRTNTMHATFITNVVFASNVQSSITLNYGGSKTNPLYVPPQTNTGLKLK